MLLEQLLLRSFIFWKYQREITNAFVSTIAFVRSLQQSKIKANSIFIISSVSPQKNRQAEKVSGSFLPHFLEHTAPGWFEFSVLTYLLFCLCLCFFWSTNQKYLSPKTKSQLLDFQLAIFQTLIIVFFFPYSFHLAIMMCSQLFLPWLFICFSHVYSHQLDLFIYKSVSVPIHK